MLSPVKFNELSRMMSSSVGFIIRMLVFMDVRQVVKLSCLKSQNPVILLYMAGVSSKGHEFLAELIAII